jgi:metallo-beta-lactamase family protein
MKLTFYGAAGEVTGSQHLLEIGDRRILLDCGLFQGHRSESRAKNEQFHCRPAELDAVILSHAHIDHCGNLPGLHRHGFGGPVFCTAATADVAELMLTDAGKIQEEDAKYLAKKLAPGEAPVEPLYDRSHVESLLKLVQPLDYHGWRSDSNVCAGRPVRLDTEPHRHTRAPACGCEVVLDGERGAQHSARLLSKACQVKLALSQNPFSVKNNSTAVQF